jgi:enediyne biosynthesis protein E8
MEDRVIRGAVATELSRRQFIQRAGVLGAGALVAGAVPVAARMVIPPRAEADVALTDGTLQAFYDTLIPGRPATTTDLGNEIHPRAIAGVDDDPGAVEADALLLGQDARLGFTVLAVPFLAELEAFALLRGADFLDLPFEQREATCLQGLAFSNPTRAVWEAAAAVAFTAFCAAATQVNPTSETASGYRVMGHPGTAPEGYSDFSYGRPLSRELTERGYLP